MNKEEQEIELQSFFETCKKIKRNAWYLKEYEKACRNYDALIVVRNFKLAFLSFSDENKDRILMFLNTKPGWNFGKGEVLSRKAFADFLMFFYDLNKEYNISNLEISTFMGEAGDIDVCFRNKNKEVFDIEFYENRIEYYIGDTNEEIMILTNQSADKQIKDLIKKVILHYR